MVQDSACVAAPEQALEQELLWANLCFQARIAPWIQQHIHPQRSGSRHIRCLQALRDLTIGMLESGLDLTPFLKKLRQCGLSAFRRVPYHAANPSVAGGKICGLLVAGQAERASAGKGLLRL